MPVSPVSLGVAYFLLQHQKQLGVKSINKVKLVTCEDSGGDPCQSSMLDL